MAVRLSERYHASPKRVFNAWLDPKVAGKWLFATAARPMTEVAIDARVGGSFRLADRRQDDTTEHSGEYLEIVPHRRLVFTLFGENHPRVATRVIVEVAPVAKSSCELRLIHEDVPPERVSYTEARWTGILYGLGQTLASRHGQSDSS